MTLARYSIGRGLCYSGGPFIPPPVRAQPDYRLYRSFFPDDRLYLYVFLGYTINIVTLSSLAIAIGTVVDNAIVVTDKCLPLAGKGLPLKEAAIKGASEVG